MRLLTPNWQTALPGMPHRGSDPDGFMTMPEVADLVAHYACTISAPVRTGTTVTRVAATRAGFRIETDRGIWTAPTVVLASGTSTVAVVPAVAADLPSTITSMTAMEYQHPSQLADGGVLVVGASASGVQIADELRRSGRTVALAVGEHVRLPRRYRGRDVFWWLDRTGVLDERHDQVDDLVRARHVPSPQLIGSSDGRELDLNALTDAGVRIVGRLAAIGPRSFQFSGGLTNVCTLADLKMRRLLGRFDEWATAHRRDDVDRPEEIAPTWGPSKPVLDLPLASVATVVWATGHRSDHSWLDVPVFDHRGRIRHVGGVVSDAPGLYLLGANLLRRRRSSYISGADADTAELAACLHHHLDRQAARP